MDQGSTPPECSDEINLSPELLSPSNACVIKLTEAKGIDDISRPNMYLVIATCNDQGIVTLRYVRFETSVLSYYRELGNICEEGGISRFITREVLRRIPTDGVLAEIEFEKPNFSDITKYLTEVRNLFERIKNDNPPEVLYELVLSLLEIDTRILNMAGYARQLLVDYERLGGKLKVQIQL